MALLIILFEGSLLISNRKQNLETAKHDSLCSYALPDKLTVRCHPTAEGFLEKTVLMPTVRVKQNSEAAVPKQRAERL